MLQTFAPQARCSFVRELLVEHRPQQGGLPGAIRPDYAEDVTGGNAQVEGVGEGVR